MDLLERLERARSTAPEAVEKADTLAELASVEAALLGKDSDIGAVRRSMGSIDPELRPQVGAKLNEVTKEVTALLEERRSHLEHREAEERLQAERIDMTLPARSEEHTSELQSRENLVCR